jgi:hypothetical protein
MRAHRDHDFLAHHVSTRLTTCSPTSVSTRLCYRTHGTSPPHLALTRGPDVIVRLPTGPRPLPARPLMVTLMSATPSRRLPPRADHRADTTPCPDVIPRRSLPRTTKDRRALVASSARPPVWPQHHFGDFRQSQAWHTSACPIAPLHIASALVPSPS